jgi:hypothetical protein
MQNSLFNTIFENLPEKKKLDFLYNEITTKTKNTTYNNIPSNNEDNTNLNSFNPTIKKIEYTKEELGYLYNILEDNQSNNTLIDKNIEEKIINRLKEKHEHIFQTISILYFEERKELKEFILKNYDNLKTQTLFEIFDYCEKFELNIFNELNYKLVTYSFFLALQKNNDLATRLKVQSSVAMIFILNNISYQTTQTNKEPYDISKEKLRKLILSAHNKSIFEDFGKYGIYLAF